MVQIQMLLFFSSLQTLGHRVRYLFANPRGPRRARPLHPVRLEAHRERSVRRQDQGVGPASCLRHPGADEHALPQDTGGELHIEGALLDAKPIFFLPCFRSIRGASSGCNSTSSRS